MMLILWLFMLNSLQASTELLVEMFNEHLRIVFKTTTSRGLESSLLLTVSENKLKLNRSYAVYISRYICVYVWDSVVINIHVYAQN